MHCIFCKVVSSSSRTIEHIIPESLGNVEHTLPPGVVCDKCNNYFALKIEKPLLDGSYFQHSRFRKAVSNKRGRIPTIKGIHLQTKTGIEVCKTDEGLSIYPMSEKDNDRFAAGISMQQHGSLILPVGPIREINERLMSRFIGKVAIEALAQRLLAVEGGQEEVVNKVELDELRDYVRWNKSQSNWQFNERRIYNEDAAFAESDGEYEVLHEYSFLYTDSCELYFVIAIWGVEYVINMASPEIEGYEQWLSSNNQKSPLY